jgi:putative N6-adenine-specific DNA methylase
MCLKGFDEAAWETLRAEARRIPKKNMTGKIIANDNNPAAIEAAKQNAKTAGVDHVIEFSVCDFSDTPVPEGGVVVLNPEYGERMGNDKDLEPLYNRIGDFFKLRCQGHTGYVFTGNAALGKRIGLRTNRKIQFFNGPIECRLLVFQLYEGTKRKSKLGNQSLDSSADASAS